MILERLSREPYRLTMRRGSARIGTVPDAVQVGPKVCLINKYSASDGDLFPWGFRALGLGKLIGTRTWGGIQWLVTLYGRDGHPCTILHKFRSENR